MAVHLHRIAALLAFPLALVAASPSAAQPGDEPSRGPVAAVDSRPAAAAPSARPGWGWPLSGDPLPVNTFHVGPQRWSPGHRGVDLAATTGASVLAAGAGTVAFVGRVAGRGVVTVQHADGLRTTYEPVTGTLSPATPVQLGTPIGTLETAGSHCPARVCLHWGLIRQSPGQQGEYLDPLALIRRPDPPILLPLDGPRDADHGG